MLMYKMETSVPVKPIVNFQDVKDLVFDLYGFRVTQVEELNGYDDKNFHITIKNDTDIRDINSYSESECVLKIINALDSKNSQLFEEQSALLLHLKGKGILCPQPILTKDKLPFTKVKLISGEHIVRLLKYINGSILYKVPCTPNLLRQAGEFVANLDDALKDFRHDAYESHKHFWMLESVPSIRQLLFAVSDEERRKLILNVVEKFEDRVLSVSNDLERGLIHGDFNEQNIIVDKEGDDWSIKAVIDFGDCHVACYLYEIAITMTYMILQAKDLGAGGHVLAGYSSVRKLPDKEFSLLKVCVAARLCQSLVVGAYTNLQDPKNSYVLVTAAHGWKLLEDLWREPEENLLARWKEISQSL
ncbi:hypothetical protein NQ318_018705 [Aromia moschata]|uniref:Hydroxylysine kinase n=1 Tax=Aromia moschata TaxID=1265417 RepID=A0AAV8ZG04_9CUCU|nr:hypothetical protein NQ318_018705 [Aromia moschata]